MSGKGDITNPRSWQDTAGHVPPLVYQNVPQNTNYPLNGDGRYWFVGNASNIPFANNVVNLIHFDGANNSLTAVDVAGGIQFSCINGFFLSTASPKFGTACLDALAAQAHYNTNINSTGYSIANPACYGAIPTHENVLPGDFTIEGWVNISAIADVPYYVFDYGQTNYSSANGLRLQVASNAASVAASFGPGGTIIATVGGFTMSTAAWHHFAVVAHGTNLTLYIDGVNVATTTGWNSTWNPAGQNPQYLTFGGSPAIAGSSGTGYVDEVRVSNIAQYTANFTPPTGPFPLVISNVINFIGDPTFGDANTATFTWQITELSTDNSIVSIVYSTDGVNYTFVPLPNGLQGLQSGAINIALAGATTLQLGTVYNGTAVTGATNTEVAIAITRNNNEAPAWDNPNPFDPVSYNSQCMDQVVPTDTLANLRTRMMIRLGYAAQAATPTPGMVVLLNDFLISAQKFLYKRFTQLHTRRLFRWKLVPLQRFYSIKDNDEDVLCNFTMDATRTIEWAGIQDSRNVWYPLIEGIEPQLYTMIDKPWRPARYEIRQAIEVYPAPDQTYWMWFKAHFGLLAFAADSDNTTIDAELVFLHALANAKAHYGQPDANNIESQANAYRRQIIAGSHTTNTYIPGSQPVPPAVRPTLIQFSNNN